MKFNIENHSESHFHIPKAFLCNPNLKGKSEDDKNIHCYLYNSQYFYFHQQEWNGEKLDNPIELKLENKKFIFYKNVNIDARNINFSKKKTIKMFFVNFVH